MPMSIELFCAMSLHEKAVSMNMRKLVLHLFDNMIKPLEVSGLPLYELGVETIIPVDKIALRH